MDAATSRVFAPEPIDSQRRLVLPLGHTQLGCALQRRGSLAGGGLLGVARPEWACSHSPSSAYVASCVTMSVSSNRASFGLGLRGTCWNVVGAACSAELVRCCRHGGTIAHAVLASQVGGVESAAARCVNGAGESQWDRRQRVPVVYQRCSFVCRAMLTSHAALTSTHTACWASAPPASVPPRACLLLDTHILASIGGAASAVSSLRAAALLLSSDATATPSLRGIVHHALALAQQLAGRASPACVLVLTLSLIHI